MAARCRSQVSASVDWGLRKGCRAGELPVKWASESNFIAALRGSSSPIMGAGVQKRVGDQQTAIRLAKTLRERLSRVELHLSAGDTSSVTVCMANCKFVSIS